MTVNKGIIKNSNNMEHNLMSIGKNTLLRVALIGAPLLTALTISSCADDETVASDKLAAPERLAFNVSIDNGWQDETRGTPVNTLYDPFGIFVYKFKADDYEPGVMPPITPDPTMLNDQVTEGPSGGWLTSNTFGWPQENQILFFAYYPYQDPDDEEVIAGNAPMTLPTENTPGYLSIQYETPKNALDQVDLMGAASYMMNGVYTIADAPKSITLTFHHLLAGVQFTTGTFSELGKITKIVLNRVLRSGTVTFYPRSGELAYDDEYVWSFNDSYYDSFTTEPNYTVASGYHTGVTINSGRNTLLLLPQTLGADASIDLYYYSNGVERKLSTNSIAGKKLEMGKITIFKLTVESLKRLTVETSVTDWHYTTPEEGSITDGDPVAPEAIVNTWNTGTGATQADMDPLTEYPEDEEP